MNPETLLMKDRGLPLNNFIDFGTMTSESPLALKTVKRWCPLKVKKEEQHIPR
ncbi:hypothetical protein [Brevibacillus reuszeri]|uniref:hypothetical protein n=1 Tax=Brevibacillus reuszeri TaxID=54915 RepID=UPI001F17D85F|nr:hypothetical protein [Brevibacillus reuszeri]